MQKRQNIFSSPQVRLNSKQAEQSSATPQVPLSPEGYQHQNFQMTGKSPDYKDEQIKDQQVQPSSKPNIRQMKQSSLPKPMTAQSLQSSTFKSLLQNAGQTQASAPPATAGTVTSFQGNAQTIISQASLQSPPRPKPKIQNQQQQANKGYQRCCPSHNDEALKRICSIAYCNRDILICGDCMYEDPDHTKQHQQDIILVNDFLDVVEREGNKHNWKALLEKQKDMFSQQTQNLSHFPEKHAKEYGEYIEIQKVKIHNDITIISQIFQTYLQALENEMIQALNNQLLHVCQQLETLRMEVLNIQDLDQRVYINPRGYLEHQLQVNENMEEVSQHFRWIRDILFGEKITIESQKIRKQNIEQMGVQLTQILKNPPDYTVLSKETLKEIEKRIAMLITNATSEMRFSLSKDPSMLNQNDTVFYTKLINGVNNIATSKNQENPNIKNNQGTFGLFSTVGGRNQKDISQSNVLQSSLNPNLINSTDSNAFYKEELLKRLLDSNRTDGVNENGIQNQKSKNNNQIQSTAEYIYNQNKPKSISEISSEIKEFNIDSEEQVKHTKNSGISSTMKRDDAQQVNRNNQGIQNRTNNFQIKDENQKNKYIQGENNQLNSKANNGQNKNNNYIQQHLNIDDLEALTPNSNVTPLKQNNQNINDQKNQNKQFQYNLNILQDKNQHQVQQQGIQSQPVAWQQNQPNLETIPELNLSSSANSAFTSKKSHVNNKNNIYQETEIMNGSKVVSIRSKEIDQINLSQIPNEITLKEKTNCLCVIGGALIACGDNKGSIKLYNLSSQNCIGEYTAHKSSISCIHLFQGESPFIASGSNGDNQIHLYNIIDDKSNIILKEVSNSQPSSQGSIRQSQQIQNINFISSLFDERNIVSVMNNFSTIYFWDIQDKKKMQSIKPIIQTGDTSSSQVTSIHCMGRAMQSVLIGYKCCKVGIYKIEYEGGVNKVTIDSNKISKVILLKQVELGQGNIPHNIQSLLNNKVFISVKKNILVWDTQTFEICEKIDSYQNDQFPSTEINDILIAYYSDIQQYSTIQICKNDSRIVVYNSNKQSGMKYHIKDFKIIDSIFKEKIQFCKNHVNELFIVALNQNKNSITYWKLFENS